MAFSIGAPSMENSHELLILWRNQRARRVGKILCVAGMILGLIAVFIDLRFAPIAVILTDLLMITGCAISLQVSRRRPDQSFFWWPMYLGIWINMWPSVWETGGVNSPLFALFLAILYIAGMTIQTRISQLYLTVFIVLNIAGMYILSLLATAEMTIPPESFSLTAHLIGTAAIGTCIAAFLRTEQNLAQQFSERYIELSQTKADLRKEEASNFAKTTFLANVSHELRTPLGAILGFSELLSNPGTSKTEQDTFIEVIQRNSQQLSRLVDDLLDLSRMDAGIVEIEKTEIHLPNLLTDVLMISQIAANKKNIPVRLNYLNPIPEFVFSDSLRLRQILINLIGNAVKFTDRGQVTVSLKHLPSTEGDELAIYVSDTGRGILEDERPRLFKPFSQGDPSLARRYGGTGLGLSLSRKLATLLGGRLELSESKLDIGSTFVLTMPVGAVPQQRWLAEFLASHPAEKPKVQSVEAGRLRGRKILFVDDMIDNQELIRAYLTGAGAEVETASNGFEGVDKAMRNDYDLILMDIQMPLMDGYEAVSSLRRLNYSKPIYAITAHARKADWERCIAIGCNGHLSKPITGENLVTAIAKALENPLPTASSTDRGPADLSV